jgi:hypothetical protein
MARLHPEVWCRVSAPIPGGLGLMLHDGKWVKHSDAGLGLIILFFLGFFLVKSAWLRLSFRGKHLGIGAYQRTTMVLFFFGFPVESFVPAWIQRQRAVNHGVYSRGGLLHVSICLPMVLVNRCHCVLYINVLWQELYAACLDGLSPRLAVARRRQSRIVQRMFSLEFRTLVVWLFPLFFAAALSTRQHPFLQLSAWHHETLSLSERYVLISYIL